jgi:hypothetical protein
LLAALAVVSVALGWDVWKLQREVLRLRAESATASANSQQQLQHLTQKLAAANRTQREADDRLRARAGNQAPRSPNAFGLAWQKGWERLQRDPKFLALNHRRSQENIQTNYGDLLASLHLPADKLAKLKTLLADRMDSVADARAAASDLGLSDPAAVAQAAKQANDEINQEIEALVGDTDYSKLNDFATLQGPLRGVREQYLNDLAYAGVPLDSDQAVALARIVREVWDPATNPDSLAQRSQVIDPETGYTAIDQELINRASNLLSPEQLAIIKASQTATRQQNLIYQNLSKQANAAAAAAASP